MNAPCYFCYREFMKDRYFFPLAMLVIAGILALAILPGKRAKGPTPDEMRANGIMIEGQSLQRLVASPATLVNFTTDGVSGKMIAVLSTNIPRKMAVPSAGVFAAIPPAYKSVFSGQRLKITIVARKGSLKPLQEFDASYFQTSGPQSGWKSFELTPTFKEYIYYYAPKPINDKKPSIDYAGIWPGTAGHGETMDVKSISIVISPKVK